MKNIVLMLLLAVTLTACIGYVQEPVPAPIHEGETAVAQIQTQLASPPKEPDSAKNNSRYCGEDMKRYFALHLLNETIAMFMVPFYRAQDFSVRPIDQGWWTTYKAEFDSTGQRLKDNNCYFYNNGSVFMDYKQMRNARFAEGAGPGTLSGWQQANFSANTSTDDVLAKCLAEVSTWWP